MEVGDMLNARHAAAADAQLRQQMHQAARLDARNTYTMNANHAAVNHHRSIPQDTSHLGYASLNHSPPTQQMTPDSFMMGQSQPDSEEISNGNERLAGEPAPKSFACSTCAKRFARRSDLARHERIHSGIRPHSCDWPGCGKQFIQRSALTVHARVHTGEKPHLCERCGKPFSDSSSLARHRRIHTGTRPFKCPYANCQKTFTRRTTLTRHKQSHTGSVEQAAADTQAKLSNNISAQQQQEGEYSDNASSHHSNESPSQRPLSMSPGQELPSIPNMARQSQDFGYMPQNGALPPHMRNDFSQNSPRSSQAMNSTSLSAFTSAPQHHQQQQQRPSLTSHPAAYGPPQPLEPPANGTASGSGSPHLTALGWGSPNSPGPIDSFPYPDLPHPSYPNATSHQLYYPGSNIRRPQSTEPEDYGLRPRTNNTNNIHAQSQQHHHMNQLTGASTSHPHQQSMHQLSAGHHHSQSAASHHDHTQQQQHQQLGVEWSSMPTMNNMSGMHQQHPHHAQHHSSLAGMGVTMAGMKDGTGKYVLQ